MSKWTVGLGLLLSLSLIINMGQYVVIDSYQTNCIFIDNKTKPKILQVLKDYIKVHNRKLGEKYIELLAETYYEAGTAYDIDPLLLAAIGHQESSYNRFAISDKGALGLQQIMPKYWVNTVIPFINTDEDLFDVRKNIHAGAFIVNFYRDLCGDKALMCYYGGERAAKNPKPHLVKYTSEVLEKYNSMEFI